MISEIEQGSLTKNLTFGPIRQAGDHVTPATGKALTVLISKNGGAYAAPVGAIHETGFGEYYIQANASDTDTLGTLFVQATGAGCDFYSDNWDVQPAAGVFSTSGAITADDLLREMFTMDNELEIEVGESDEATALRALSMSQKYMEIVAGAMPRVLQTTSEFGSSNAEFSNVPTGIIRLDALWRLSASGGSQVYEMTQIQSVGGHAPASPWPFQWVATGSPGAPTGYYPTGLRYYWEPTPDQTYYFRAYGLFRAPKFANRGTAFVRQDECSLLVSSFANRLMDMNVADDSSDTMAAAQSFFRPALRTLGRHSRTRPMGRRYTQFHTT